MISQITDSLLEKERKWIVSCEAYNTHVVVVASTPCMESPLGQEQETIS